MQPREVTADFSGWGIALLVYGLVLGVVIYLAIALESTPLKTIGGIMWASGAIAGLALLGEKKRLKKVASGYLGLIWNSGWGFSDLGGCLAGILLAVLLTVALPFVLGPIVWIIALLLKPGDE